MTRDRPSIDRDAAIAASMARLVEDSGRWGLTESSIPRALSLMRLVHPLLLKLSLLVQRMLRLLLQRLLDLSLAHPGRRLSRLWLQRLFHRVSTLGLVLLGDVVGEEDLLGAGGDLGLLLLLVLDELLRL